jgi:isoquinoline 1-oxidoreductase alpha subunit
MTVRFTLNGHPASFEGEGDTPLLWALREDFGLTGTKYGCGIAQCGACTVHVDGRSRRSCVTPVERVAGRSVTTIEGAEKGVAQAVKAAWRGLDVPQCGFCQSGQIMSAIDLLSQRPNPTDAEIDQAMAGNICRCATYFRIRKAIKEAAASMSKRV